MTRIPIREDEWEQTVVEAATTLGWHVAGFRALRRKDGSWETPVRHDGKGYPDLTMCRERVIFVELKGSTGQLRPEQVEWLRWLKQAGAEAYAWSPIDWDEALATLARRNPR